MAYLGNLEGSGFSKVDSQRFNGNNSDTSFTLRHNVGQPEHIEVYVENVRQDPFTAYTVSGKTLTFTGTPPTGTGNIYVVYIGGAINTTELPFDTNLSLKDGISSAPSLYRHDQIGTGLFTADNTFLRAPVWLTPSDLGFRRANNYVTLFLDVYDPTSNQGIISFTVKKANPDGTASALPPGLSIDSTTGEIAGLVPYQPAVTKEYKFTVTAVRAGTGVDFVTVNIIPYEDQQQGSDQLKINKLPLGQQDGLDDLNSLLNEKIKINDVEYTVSGVNGNNANYDVLTLSSNLTATDLKAVSYTHLTLPTNREV